MKKIVGLLSIPTKYYLKISYQDAFSNSQYFPFSFFGGNVGGLSVIFHHQDYSHQIFFIKILHIYSF